MKSVKIILFALIIFSNINLFAQEDKTVTLVVSGSGKTQEEAKLMAFRNAIEQSFGVFISSKTVLNNDSFISDNVNQLSQGSIQKFEILVSDTLPNDIYILTMRVQVSLTEMQKVTISLGHNTTIAGGLFGLNIKMNKLQADAEKKVIADLVEQSLIILENSLNREIEIKPPILSDLRNDLQSQLNEGDYESYWNTNGLKFTNIYKLRMIVRSYPNKNLDIFIEHFRKTLESIKMSQSEIEFAKQSGIKIYPIQLFFGKEDYSSEYWEPDTFSLRNLESIKLLHYLFENSTLNLINYKIVANDNIINYTPFFNINNDTNKIEVLFNSKSANLLQLIDSSHYVLLKSGFLGSREVDQGSHGMKLDANYPCNLDTTYKAIWMNDGYYQLFLYKTTSTRPTKQGVYYGRKIRHKFGYRDYSLDIETDIKSKLNDRYQMIDFYLPLSDIEMLNDIKIIQLESPIIYKGNEN